MNRLIAAAICLLWSNIQSHDAMAADVRPFISGIGAFRAVVIEGIIEPGDFDAFLRIVRENQGRVSGVYIFSPGGDFYEAMKIGRAMRALDLHSRVPIRDRSGHPSCDSSELFRGPEPKDPRNCTCASAGFFIHIGGVSRSGMFMAVHRPYFEKGRFGALSQGDAQKAFDDLQNSARDYMQEMGVPKHVQEDVLGTPSDSALVLDEKTVRTYFFGALPYKHEWTINKCSKVSDAELKRADEYARRFGRAVNAQDVSKIDLSKAELDDWNAITKKQGEERKCATEIGEQSRPEAYARYFGTKPTDFGNHRFADWTSAPQYLGRRFYELLGEEKFEESQTMQISSLQRTTTAYSPFISLYDSPLKHKLVTSISVISAPNPSPEFARRLVSSLEDAWGKQFAGNGTAEWLWKTKEFSAKLASDVGGEGPVLRLQIVEQ